jgi:hypothetical protein
MTTEQILELFEKHAGRYILPGSIQDLMNFGMFTAAITKALDNQKAELLAKATEAGISDSLGNYRPYSDFKGVITDTAGTTFAKPASKTNEE